MTSTIGAVSKTLVPELIASVFPLQQTVQT